MQGKIETGKIFGTYNTYQHLTEEEIKWRFNAGNACYHSVQNLLSSRLLLKSKAIAATGCGGL
jgi:hypothetical protein